MQRHHLLPRQLLSAKAYGRLFDAIGHERIGFDDFRRNGLLLPAEDAAAMRIGLPLHRGPHKIYNCMVAERVGQVEASWAFWRRRSPQRATEEALMRLELLQRALRRRLLSESGPRLRLNRKAPLGSGLDFSGLDAMAETLWSETQGAASMGHFPVESSRYLSAHPAS